MSHNGPAPTVGPVPAPPPRFVCPCGDRAMMLTPQLADHLRNCSVFRNDVTSRFCAGAQERGSGSTHHLIPRRVGTMRGEPVFEHRCRGCGKTASMLRHDSAIEAAIARILGTEVTP